MEKFISFHLHNLGLECPRMDCPHQYEEPRIILFVVPLCIFSSSKDPLWSRMTALALIISLALQPAERGKGRRKDMPL